MELSLTLKLAQLSSLHDCGACGISQRALDHFFSKTKHQSEQVHTPAQFSLDGRGCQAQLAGLVCCLKKKRGNVCVLFRRTGLKVSWHRQRRGRWARIRVWFVWMNEWMNVSTNICLFFLSFRSLVGDPLYHSVGRWLGWSVAFSLRLWHDDLRSGAGLASRKRVTSVHGWVRAYVREWVCVWISHHSAGGKEQE